MGSKGRLRKTFDCLRSLELFRGENNDIYVFPRDLPTLSGNSNLRSPFFIALSPRISLERAASSVTISVKRDAVMVVSPASLSVQ